MTTMHQLRVTLEDLEPPIWRRLLVPSDLRLDQVAQVLLTGMGWQGYHLYAFRIGENSYGDPHSDDPPEDELPATVPLRDVATEGEAFSFDYDFGDGWTHHVLVEAIIETDDSKPQCVAGERACPPEDVGGPGGYLHALEALADPDHKDHEDYKRWMPDGFDPEAFDVVTVDQQVLALFRGRRRR